MSWQPQTLQQLFEKTVLERGKAEALVTGITHLGNILDVYDGGSFFGVPLDGGCGTLPSAIQAREDTYRSQYGHATFAVKTSP